MGITFHMFCVMSRLVISFIYCAKLGNKDKYDSSVILAHFCKNPNEWNIPHANVLCCKHSLFCLIPNLRKVFNKFITLINLAIHFLVLIKHTICMLNCEYCISVPC